MLQLVNFNSSSNPSTLKSVSIDRPCSSTCSSNDDDMDHKQMRKDDSRGTGEYVLPMLQAAMV